MEDLNWHIIILFDSKYTNQRLYTLIADSKRWNKITFQLILLDCRWLVSLAGQSYWHVLIDNDNSGIGRENGCD